MAESSNGQVLREWGPLTDLLQKVPRKIHSGILSQEVKITCVDVVPEFVALGTNVGLVYWYSRAKRDLDKLQCENPNSQISTIRVISTVDYMLACGTTSGTINIFQIPKVHPDDIPENLKPKKQQVERYLVSDMHKTSVSALEWSKNGMKLFSGDGDGIVVLTELDFYMHICKSVEILNESYEVVQLSCHRQNLLISTTYRSIICRKSEKWKITQVGRKGRKIFGNYGGIVRSDGPRPNSCLVYCTRPGLRIWISDVEGNVQKTILFRDALRRQDTYITSMSPASNPEDEAAFGTLATFRDNLLVTHCPRVLYVLDPQKMGVVRKFHSSRRILDVSISKEEIFILEENRSLVRLGYRPETINHETCFGLPVNVFPTSMNILGLTLDGCSVTPGFAEYDGESSTASTEEAIECTGEESCFDDADAKTPNRGGAETVGNTYSKISQEDYDENIIYRHRRYAKSHPRNGVNERTRNDGEAGRVAMSAGSVPILPDLRSPESIRSDIETKEKLISEILNFDKVKIAAAPRSERDTVDSNRSGEVKGNKNLNEGLDLKVNNLIDVDRERTTTGCGNDPVKSHQSNNVNWEAEISIDGVNNDLIKSSSFGYDSAASKDSTDVQQTKHDITPTIPDVMAIPSDWNLSCVELKQKERTITESDSSLNDWEII